MAIVLWFLLQKQLWVQPDDLLNFDIILFDRSCSQNSVLQALELPFLGIHHRFYEEAIQSFWFYFIV